MKRKDIKRETITETSPELLLRAALPIDDVDRVCFPPDDWIVVVWIDTSERPDFDTLASKHGIEGGQAVCTWFPIKSHKREMQIGLRISMLHPTNIAIHVIFPVRTHFRCLESLAKQGKVWFAPGPCPSLLQSTQFINKNTFLGILEKYCGKAVMIELDASSRKGLEVLLSEWPR